MKDDWFAQFMAAREELREAEDACRAATTAMEHAAKRMRDAQWKSAGLFRERMDAALTAPQQDKP